MLIAVLAVFVQALSPNKYRRLGVMVVYIVSTIVARARSGFEHNLYHYGAAPQVPLSDMNGAGQLLGRRLVVPALLGGLRGHPAGRSPTCCGGAGPRPG